MGYEVRQRIEGHKRIICQSLDGALLCDRTYKIFNRHLVTDSESKKSRREWFEAGDIMDIRRVYGIVQNLKRNGNSYVIWYGQNVESDLISFEEEMRTKKEVYIPQLKKSEMDNFETEVGEEIK